MRVILCESEIRASTQEGKRLGVWVSGREAAEIRIKIAPKGYFLHESRQGQE